MCYSNLNCEVSATICSSDYQSPPPPFPKIFVFKSLELHLYPRIPPLSKCCSIEKFSPELTLAMRNLNYPMERAQGIANNSAIGCPSKNTLSQVLIWFILPVFRLWSLVLIRKEAELEEKITRLNNEGAGMQSSLTGLTTEITEQKTEIEKLRTGKERLGDKFFQQEMTISKLEIRLGAVSGLSLIRN